MTNPEMISHQWLQERQGESVNILLKFTQFF